MKKNNFKRKLLICFFSILAVTQNPISNLKAEDNPLTQKQQIEIAKKIWEMESLYKKGDEKSISKLCKFLEDENKAIREIASRKLVLINHKNAVECLKKTKNEDIKGKYKIANILINSKDKKEACKEILALKNSEIEIYENKVKILDSTKNKEDKEKIFNSLEKLRNENSGEFIYIFCEKGWIEYFLMEIKKYPKLARNIEQHPEVVYTRIKERINKLSKEERKRELIDLLMNWEIVMEYEAAIRILSEMGEQVVPDILKLLKEEKNIPAKEAPPWDRQHTNFNILLTVLKSIPDERTIPELEKLSKSKVKYVSQLAKDTLEWVKSGVPYPFKYERILLRSTDEILPEKK